MKTTGRIRWMAVGLALLAAGGVWAGDVRKPEMAIRMRAVVPQQDEDWDMSGGVEVQARIWNSARVGTVLSFGCDSWSARESRTDASSIYGSASLFPVGASILLRNDVSDSVALTLEGGFRYAFVVSRLTAEYNVTRADGTTVLGKDTIRPDNAVLGVLGVAVESEVDEGLSLQFGVDLQFDLARPHETFQGRDMGETSFRAAAFHFGVTWAF